MITLQPYRTSNGDIIWAKDLAGLGAVSATLTTLQTATQLANQSSALAANLRDVKPGETPNNLGKAVNGIALASGTVATAAIALAPIVPLGTVVGAAVVVVAAAIAAVATLIGAIWGSDTDESTYALAAQLTQENTKIERENYQLDQKRDALVTSIKNAMPLIKLYAKQENINLQTAVNGLAGLMGLNAPTASQQLKAAQQTNDFLKAQQDQRILDIATLTKSFEAVANTLVARQRQLQLMNTIQTYGTYGAGAVGLGTLVFGGLKFAKGDLKTGAIATGSGLALGALAYWLYTASKKTEVLSQQGQQVLREAEVAINSTNQSTFPSKAQLLAAYTHYGTNDNKNGVFLPGGEYQNAINANYNEKTGKFTRGAWTHEVIGSNPVNVKASKGGEVFYNTTSYFLSRNQGLKGLQGLPSMTFDLLR